MSNTAELFGPDTADEDIILIVLDAAETAMRDQVGVTPTSSSATALELPKIFRIPFFDNDGELDPEEELTIWLNGKVEPDITDGDDCEEPTTLYQVGLRVETPATTAVLPPQYIRLLLETVADEDPEFLEAFVEGAANTFDLAEDIDLDSLSDEQRRNICEDYFLKDEEILLWTYEEVEFEISEAKLGISSIRRHGFRVGNTSTLVAEHDTNDRFSRYQIVHSEQHDGHQREDRVERNDGLEEAPESENANTDPEQILVDADFIRYIQDEFSEKMLVTEEPFYIIARNILNLIDTFKKPSRLLAEEPDTQTVAE